MGKVRPKKSSPWVDMTPMVDLAFLLLTFFIMTATFKENEAAEITTPSSISTTKVPDDDIMIISIDRDGKVFFGVDAQPTRISMLDNIASAKGISFTEQEKAKFAIQPQFGFPIAQLKSWLNLPGLDMAQTRQPGIPVDSTGVSELADWVFAARRANPQLRIAIKGDNATKFPVFKDVLANLQSQKINKFNLITSGEQPPAGWTQD